MTLLAPTPSWTRVVRALDVVRDGRRDGRQAKRAARLARRAAAARCECTGCRIQRSR